MFLEQHARSQQAWAKLSQHEYKFLMRLLCPWIIISVLKSLISFKSTVDLCHFLMAGRRHPSRPLGAFIRFFVVNIGCSTWVFVIPSPWVFSLLCEMAIRQILSKDLHFVGFFMNETICKHSFEIYPPISLD